MGYRRLTREAFTGVEETVKAAGGDTSHAGRQRQKEGKGLDPLVDPAGYELIRRSLPRYVEQPNGSFLLTNGVPMLMETRFDTTGSMGGNVDLAFASLPKSYDLIAGGENPVLGRYDPQILNAIFGDVQDNYVLYRSQAEMDVEIANQLTLMVAEKDGGDTTEDPDYGIFGGAYLTDAFINKYGLKYYDFTVTDAPCRTRIDRANLVRVFGPTVFEKAKQNGYVLNESQLPATQEMIDELKKHTHAFVLCVGSGAAEHWVRLYGKDRVVIIEDTSVLPYVEAAIIGLTEGVLELQSVEEYLCLVGCSAIKARSITRAVAGTPISAQTILPNFSKIPLKGTLFAKKGDMWPMTEAAPVNEAEEGGMWL
jgi:hypothetical protein